MRYDAAGAEVGVKVSGEEVDSRNRRWAWLYTRSSVVAAGAFGACSDCTVECLGTYTSFARYRTLLAVTDR